MATARFLTDMHSTGAEAAAYYNSNSARVSASTSCSASLLPVASSFALAAPAVNFLRHGLTSCLLARCTSTPHAVVGSRCEQHLQQAKCTYIKQATQRECENALPRVIVLGQRARSAGEGRQLPYHRYHCACTHGVARGH